MINGLAERIATQIKEINPEQTSSIEVMKFALIILLNGFLVSLVSLTIGWFSGKLVETVVILTGFVLLRFVSGGFHFGSAVSCSVVSVIFATLLPHVPVSPNFISYSTIVSIILAAAFSPSGIEKQSRFPVKYYPILKLISVLIIASNFFIGSEELAKAFFIQCITLIRRR